MLAISRFLLSNFIDGTVAGTPADLTIYIDTNSEHDHTYYGNGCATTSSQGGSQTPCSTRIERSSTSIEGSEYQKNGTYYNFQGITSGSGGAITTDNTNAPDTFCPLGWQLPYGGTGGDYYDQPKTWKYLFELYGYDGSEGPTDVILYPLSYNLAGNFNWLSGRLYSQGIIGYYTSLTAASGYKIHRINIWDEGAIKYATSDMISSRSLRCVNFLASTHRRHGGRNKYLFS